MGYYNLKHKRTPTYANGYVCIISDAAHAITPWQGAGAGQAFEDAAVRGALFRHVSTRADIQAAFKAFGTVRRPRCRQIMDSSREMGRIMCGLSGDTGVSVQEMRNALKRRWEFIHGLNLKRHEEEALKGF